eukprot:5678644-Pleurochrysis_carterae.AAC.1
MYQSAQKIESGRNRMDNCQRRDVPTNLTNCPSKYHSISSDLEHRVAWCADERPALRLRPRAGQVPARYPTAATQHPGGSFGTRKQARFKAVNFSLKVASRILIVKAGLYPPTIVRLKVLRRCVGTIGRDDYGRASNERSVWKGNLVITTTGPATSKAHGYTVRGLIIAWSRLSSQPAGATL